MKVGKNYVGKLKSVLIIMGFPDSSVGEESACNAGDPGPIPGSGRSAGEGIGYQLQYSFTKFYQVLVLYREVNLEGLELYCIRVKMKRRGRGRKEKVG